MRHVVCAVCLTFVRCATFHLLSASCPCCELSECSESLHAESMNIVIACVKSILVEGKLYLVRYHFPLCTILFCLSLPLFLSVMAMFGQDTVDHLVTQIDNRSHNRDPAVVQTTAVFIAKQGFKDLLELSTSSFDKDWDTSVVVLGDKTFTINAGVAGFCRQLITDMSSVGSKVPGTPGSATVSEADMGAIGTQIAEAMQAAADKQPKKKQLVHISIQDHLAKLELHKLGPTLWPKSMSTDKMATEFQSVKDLGVPQVFVHSDLKEFVPPWAVEIVKNKPGPYLTPDVWSAAFLRWAIAADACGMVCPFQMCLLLYQVSENGLSSGEISHISRAPRHLFAYFR